VKRMVTEEAALERTRLIGRVTGGDCVEENDEREKWQMRMVGGVGRVGVI